MSACSYRGRKGSPVFDYPRGVFPCFRTASVRLREASDRTHFGNPFRERDVCRVHADEMVASGWYVEVGPLAGESASVVPFGNVPAGRIGEQETR